MKILLLGKDGQIGWELHRSLLAFPQLTALGRDDFDLTVHDPLRQRIRSLEPDLIINAAAHTDVDRAESDPDAAYQVNAVAPGVLAEEAQRLGSLLIHFSTDYVFDGTKGRAYQEDDPPNPLNAYGRTKLQGESTIRQIGGYFMILRTSWVYSLRRPCFLTRLLERARTQAVVRVVDDQVGSPTWCRSLSEAVARLVVMAAALGMGWLREGSGLYHLAGAGSASRFEWARLILELDPKARKLAEGRLQPAKSSEFPSPAQRPSYSALSSEHFGRRFGFQLPEWKTALLLAMDSREIRRRVQTM
jgi:dTDP-4-dehydrorhamnose reductase